PRGFTAVGPSTASNMAALGTPPTPFHRCSRNSGTLSQPWRYRRDRPPFPSPSCSAGHLRRSRRRPATPLFFGSCAGAPIRPRLAARRSANFGIKGHEQNYDFNAALNPKSTIRLAAVVAQTFAFATRERNGASPPSPTHLVMRRGGDSAWRGV